MTSIDYAKERISIFKDEMGEIQQVFESDGKLYIEFENGMNLQLHNDEINYQAIEYLEYKLRRSASNETR